MYSEIIFLALISPLTLIPLFLFPSLTPSFFFSTILTTEAVFERKIKTTSLVNSTIGLLSFSQSVVYTRWSPVSFWIFSPFIMSRDLHMPSFDM